MEKTQKDTALVKALYMTTRMLEVERNTAPMLREKLRMASDYVAGQRPQYIWAQKGIDGTIEKIDVNRLVTSWQNNEPDPRRGIRVDCIFIGEAAKRPLPLHDILSFLYPIPGTERVFYKVCFSRYELHELCERARTSDGSIDEAGIPNPFRDEMYEKLPNVRDLVLDTLSAEFLRSFEWMYQYREAVQALHEAETSDPVLYNEVLKLMRANMKQKKSAMQQGGFVGRIKGFGLAAVDKGIGFVRWLYEHPLWSTAALVVIRIVRLLICLSVVDVQSELIREVIETLVKQSHAGDFTNVIVEVVTHILNCFVEFAKGGFMVLNPQAWLTCAATTLRKGSRVMNAIYSSISDFIMFALRKLFERFWPDSTVFFILQTLGTFFKDPFQMGKMLTNDPQMKPTTFSRYVRQKNILDKIIDTDGYIQQTMFFGLLFAIPSQAIQSILVYAESILPGRLPKAVKKTILDLAKKNGSLGDILYQIVRQATAGALLLKFISELYHFIQEAWKCIASPLVTWFRDVTGSKVARGGNGACCFQEIFRVIHQTAVLPTASTHAMADVAYSEDFGYHDSH